MRVEEDQPIVIESDSMAHVGSHDAENAIELLERAIIVRRKKHPASE